MIQISRYSSLDFGSQWKLDFQVQEHYIQRFKPTDLPRVQYVEDTSSPALVYMNINGSITEITPTVLTNNDTLSIREFTIDLTGLSGCVHVYFEQEGEIVLSSMFEVTDEVDDTILLEYTHRRNDFDTYFNLEAKFCFRVEGVFLPQEYSFDNETEGFRDQRHKAKELSSYTIEKRKLTIGGGFGVPNWVARLVNNIFSLSNVHVDGIRTIRSNGSAIEISTLHNDYPLYIYKLELETTEDEEAADIISLLRVVDSKKKVARSTGDSVRTYNVLARELGVTDSKMIRELLNIAKISDTAELEVDIPTEANSNKITVKQLREYILSEITETIEELKDLLNWFGMDNSGNIYVKDGKNFYTEGGISSGGPGVGGSGSADAFASLVDVLLTNPGTGDLISYNGSHWVNIKREEIEGGEVVGGATQMSELSDVMFVGIQNGDLLRYNGVRWVNVPSSTLIPSLDGYATEAWVMGKGYATESYVTQHINSVTANIGSLSAQLGNYLPRTEAANIYAPKATTLAGYGITDAVTLDTEQTITGVKRFNSNIVLSQNILPAITFRATDSNLSRTLFLNGYTNELCFTDNYWQHEYTLLHSGNYTNYAPSIFSSAVGQVDMLAAGSDLNNLGAGYSRSRDNTDYVNAPYRNFGVLTTYINTEFKSQLLLPYGTNGITYRSQYYNGTEVVWSDWRWLLDSTNYNGYLTSYLTKTDAAATYLPLGGGKLTSTERNVLYIKSTQNYGPMFNLTDKDDKLISSIGHIPSACDEQHGLWIGNVESHIGAMFGNDGEAYIINNLGNLRKAGKIYHSGNSNLTSVNWAADTITLKSYNATDWAEPKGSSRIKLFTNLSNTVGTAPRAWASGISVMTSYVGFQLGIYGSADDSNLYFRKMTDTQVWTQWQNILHSGNYNSYAPKLDGTGATGTWGINVSGNAGTASNADKLGGKSIEQIYRYSVSSDIPNDLNDMWNRAYLDSTAYDYAKSAEILNQPLGNNVSDARGVLTIHNDYDLQLSWQFSDASNMYARTHYYNGWTAWKKFAFTDSNVASATKLQTARKLWGQSFDGSGDVDGHLSVGEILPQNTAGRAELSVVTKLDFPCDIMLGTNGEKQWSITARSNTETSSLPKSFNIYNYERGYGFTITNYLNVGIGTTSPIEKLHVVGSVYVEGNIIATGGVTSGGPGSGGGGGASYGRLDDWANYNAANGDVLSAVLGYGLKTRIEALEAAGSLSSVTVKLGNTAYQSVNGTVSLPAYPTSLPASDVYAWAKASTKPSYEFSEIKEKPTTLGGYGITNSFVLWDSGKHVNVKCAFNNANTVGSGYLEWWSDAGWMNHAAGGYIVAGGTSSQFLKADGSLDSTAYAPKATTLAGYGITDAVTLDTEQTITGVKRFNSNIVLSQNILPAITFRATDSNLSRTLFLNGYTNELCFTDNYWQHEYTLLHSGNYTNYAPSIFSSAVGQVDMLAAGSDLNNLGAGYSRSRDNTDYVNAPYRNFGVLTTYINTEFKSQLLLPYGTNGITYRSQYYNGTEVVWSDWRWLLDSTNYNGYLTSYLTKTDAAATYLPLGGGKLTSTERNVLYIKSTQNYGPMFNLTDKDDKLISSIGHIPSACDEQHGLWIGNVESHIGAMFGNDGEAYIINNLGNLRKAGKIYHSGNSNLTSVNWAADTITLKSYNATDWAEPKGSSRIKLFTNLSNTVGTAPRAWASGISVMTSYVGFQLGIYGSADDSNLYFRKMTDTQVWTQWQNILHSGNYNSYAPKLDGTGATGTWGINVSGNAGTASNADKLGGKSIEQIYRYSVSSDIPNDLNDMWNRAYLDSTAYDYAKSAEILNQPLGNNVSDARGVLTIHNDYDLQLSWQFSDASNMYARTHYYNGWTAWKKFAFTDSNVASATKLQTARKLWGQSFDGSGDVDGHLSVGEILPQNTAGRAELSVVTKLDFPCDIMLGTNGEKQWSITARSNTETSSLPKSFNIYNYERGYGFTITNYLNVGIGTTSPIEKLHVVGSVYVEGNIIATGGVSAASVSDARLKENVRELTGAMELINRIGVRKFNYNATALSMDATLVGEHAGYIAQEFAAVLPQYTRDMYGCKYLGIQYDKMIPYLTAGLQEVDKKAETIKAVTEAILGVMEEMNVSEKNRIIITNNLNRLRTL